MNITKSQRQGLYGAIAALTVCMVVLQSWLDRPDMRRQPAIEPRKAGAATSFVTNTGAALPFTYTLGAMAGFRQVIAGLLWVRSDAFFHEGNYDAILPLIRLITWLDPNWLDPYATGAWHLMYNFTDTDQRSDRRYLAPGIALLQEGIENNPTTYDMYKEAGWNEFDKIKDFKKALEFYLAAEKNDPNYDITQVGHQVAHCYERLGDEANAIKAWNDCIAAHEKIIHDPKSTPDAISRATTGEKTCKNNLEGVLARQKFRPHDSAIPVDSDFTVKVTRIKPKVIEFSGTWNLVGAQSYNYQQGTLFAGPVDGARVVVRLQDAGYVMPEPKEFSFEVPENLTIMQDILSVRGGSEVKTGELYIASKTDYGNVPKNAQEVGVYSFPPSDNAGLGIPLNKAMAQNLPMTDWGKLQAVTAAYPQPFGAGKRLYTPAEVTTKFAQLKGDSAKIADLAKQGFCVATKSLYVPGKWSRQIDMSKDPKMYSFAADKYDVICYVDPRQTPEFVRDRIGYLGQALQDKNYIDTKTVPGVRMLRCQIELSRDDILGKDRKVLYEK